MSTFFIGANSPEDLEDLIDTANDIFDRSMNSVRNGQRVKIRILEDIKVTEQGIEATFGSEALQNLGGDQDGRALLEKASVVTLFSEISDVLATSTRVVLTNDQVESLLTKQDGLLDRLLECGIEDNDLEVEVVNLLSLALVKEKWPIYRDVDVFVERLLLAAKAKGYATLGECS